MQIYLWDPTVSDATWDDEKPAAYTQRIAQGRSATDFTVPAGGTWTLQVGTHNGVPTEPWAFQVLIGAGVPIVQSLKPRSGEVIKQDVSLPDLTSTFKYLFQARGSGVTGSQISRTYALLDIDPVTIYAELAGAAAVPGLSVDGRAVTTPCASASYISTIRYFLAGSHTARIVAKGIGGTTTASTTFRIKIRIAVLGFAFDKLYDHAKESILERVTKATGLSLKVVKAASRKLLFIASATLAPAAACS